MQTPGSDSQSERLTVIVPCLNEVHNISSTVESILKVTESLPFHCELLLIDDGSRDGTEARMRALCEEHPCCRMLVNERNLGMGRAVTVAYEQIEPGTWVTVVPGDNELLFESIHQYIPLRHEYDVILGYLHNTVIRTISRRLGSYVFRKLVNMLYGFPYRYLNGLKLYRVDAFRGLKIRSRGHAFNAELLAKALLRNPLLRVGEAPFSARGRSIGSSKAFRPRAICTAVSDVLVGYRSVARFRKEILRQARPTELQE